MGDWSDAFNDGVICAGCGSICSTEACGCPTSIEILTNRRHQGLADRGKTEQTIMRAIHNPYGYREDDH